MKTDPITARDQARVVLAEHEKRVVTHLQDLARIHRVPFMTETHARRLNA